MADSISSFFKPVSERLRSPLLSAIFIAWFAWNWEIVYVTLFTSFESNSLSKYHIVFGLANWYRGILLPILSGILYVFLIPLAENVAYKWVERQKNRRKDAKVELLKLRKHISPDELLEKYRELRDIKDEFGVLAEEKTSVRLENNKLSQEILVSTELISQLKNEVESLKTEKVSFDKQMRAIEVREALTREKRNAITVFTKGRWKCEWEFMDNHETGMEYFHVDGQNNYVVEGALGEQDRAYRLIDFYSNVENDRGDVKFFKIAPDNKEKNVFTVGENDLKIKEHGVIEGTEKTNNGRRVKVKYTKVTLTNS